MIKEQLAIWLFGVSIILTIFGVDLNNLLFLTFANICLVISAFMGGEILDRLKEDKK